MLLRHLISGVALALAGVALWSATVAAQSAADWPNKTVRMIVNFGPGGSADNSMRPFAERLSKKLGQQFVIENRGGASGALGIEGVTKSPPDGYTFVVTPALSVVILPHVRKTTYDPLKDLAPVSQITGGTLLLAVHPSVPVNSVQELVVYAKQNPGKLSWGTAGVGSHGHVLSQAFKSAAGIELLHVPYRGGGESLADFLAGVVQLHGDPNTLPHVSAGKVKLLAVIDAGRLEEFPKVPVLKEIYPEIDFIAWFGIFAPVGTPASIIVKFAQELNQVAREPDLKPLLAKAALSPNPGTPDELAALLKKDHDYYGKLVQKLNIKAE